MGKVYPPRPPEPHEPTIEVFMQYARNHSFYAVALTFEDKVLVSVCTPVQFPRSLRKRITTAIKKAIKPHKFSIHFVDQSKFRSKLPAAPS